MDAKVSLSQSGRSAAISLLAWGYLFHPDMNNAIGRVTLRKERSDIAVGSSDASK